MDGLEHERNQIGNEPRRKPEITKISQQCLYFFCFPDSFAVYAKRAAPMEHHRAIQTTLCNIDSMCNKIYFGKDILTFEEGRDRT
jgi:hypothetical protein